MRQTLSITRKELNSYFGSPMALIFIGVFLVVTLFTFFWIDGFWGRGIADLRPLFRWMPLLLIFLIAALTMRQWSEEQQAGTLELLLTLPVKITQLVIGKFLAVLALVAVALLLTFSLPFTVTAVGSLDFGPVIGGYLAAVLMASAYIAIGLFVSSRTDNQIVALIMTVILCGAFYLIGSSTATELVSASVGELLRALGTGSRFASIERGVIDLRDLAYYLSLAGSFLALNVVSLEARRWSVGAKAADQRLNRRVNTVLVISNLVVFNILLFNIDFARIDLTAGGDYTLSGYTRDLLRSANEPLLVRGYFSDETHPLLAPLIPVLRDTLEEYEIASDGQMRLEFIDPLDSPELEAEANQSYGITPTPLNFSERGSVSVINAYMDILIRYGDQTEVLNLLELIEVTQVGDSIDVGLRNLEYDLTSAIQRSIFGFQSVDAVLEALEQPAALTLYVTTATLPQELTEAPAIITQVAEEIAAASGGKFVFQTLDPTAPDSPVDPRTLSELYGIEPQLVSFFSSDIFYLSMVLETPGQEPQILFPPSGQFSEADVRAAIDSGLKRLSPGFLQVVGVWTPPTTPQTDPFGQQVPVIQEYQQLVTVLQDNYEVRGVDLISGTISPDIDVLLLVDPQNFTEVEYFAIDQYLMRGGSALVLAANYQIGLSPFSGQLELQPVQNNLAPLLAHYGVNVGQSLVLDRQAGVFITTQNRPIAGGAIVQELVEVDYPMFLDIRRDGMTRDNSIVAALTGVIMNWTSPVDAQAAADAGRTVTDLLQTSEDAWTTVDTNIQPNLQLYELGFPEDAATRGRYTVGVAVEGSFESYFAARQSPFEATPEPELTPEATVAAEATSEATAEATAPAEVTPEPFIPPAGPTTRLTVSPTNTRLVVLGSAEFLNDNIVGQFSNTSDGPLYNNNYQMILNAVDWFIEDAELAQLRTGGTAARLLDPLTEAEQSRWEAINYGFALLSLIGLGALWQIRRRSEQPMELVGVES